MEQQLTLVLEAQETFNYPEKYRGHRITCHKVEALESDHLGRFKALGWKAWIDGPRGHLQVIEGMPSREDAAAAAMQYLDIWEGGARPNDRGIELFNQALRRIQQRMEKSK